MKSVLISIQPKWCELIASGKKTVEVRKTRPKLETPFKCYIYCTKGETLLKTVNNNFLFIDHGYKDGESLYGLYEVENGQVIGEFVCDWVIGTCSWRLKGETGFGAKRTEKETNLPDKSCLTLEEIKQYAGSEGRGIYGWHISDLVIYDKPRELGEFYTVKQCNACKGGYESTACIYDENCKVPVPLTRPPPSWCYVEREG